LIDVDNKKDDNDDKLDGSDDQKRNINTSKNKYDNSINESKINADKVENKVVSKANFGFYSTFTLAILGGSFISFAAIFFTFITNQITFNHSFTQLLGGMAFSIGPILVVVAGAELFTGNNLLVISFINKKITLFQLLKNWITVYLGNFVGTLIIALLFYTTDTWRSNNYQLGLHAIYIAVNKVNLSYSESFSLGVLCNALICLGIWMTASGKSTIDKVISMFIPVTAYAAIGFEHSIANMYFIIFALLLVTLNYNDIYLHMSTIIKKPVEGIRSNLSSLNIIAFLHNLIPVTLGNIMGGSIFIGVIYWSIYMRKK